jgi:hypothetical protein
MLVATSLPRIAFADPNVPDRCKEVATVPPDAKDDTPKLAAKLALASCGAEARFAALTLAPDDASIQALANAAKPSFDLYDEVIRANDATLSPFAQKERTDLFVSMVVRMRNAIPAITMQTLGPPLAEHDRLHAELEPKLKPWLDQAK